jgi:hypothetical protein
MATHTKTALTNIPLSADEQYQASELFGKSLFSAIQLMKEQEARKRLNEYKSKYDTDSDVLQIPIPSSILPQQKVAFMDDEDQDSGIFASALKHQNFPVRMLVGGQSGFRDAKKDFYVHEKEKIQRELLDAQKEYMDVLSRIKTGSDLSTPCVDAFCNGVAHDAVFEKSALTHDDDVDMESGSIGRLLGDAMDTVKKPFRPAINTAATGLVSTGAGAAYLTYLLRKKMREQPDKYLQESMPTRVELQPYDA